MKRYEVVDVGHEEFVEANVELYAHVYGQSRPVYYREDKKKYDPRYEEKYYTNARKQARKNKMERRWK